MRTLAWLLLALLVVALPAQAKPQLGILEPRDAAPVTLYFHLLNFQDFPINTQPPDDRFSDDAPFFVVGHTASCVPNPPMTGVFQEFHTYYGYSSASYVEYDFEQEGGPRVHPERGLGNDVRFDANATMDLHWYLETGDSAAVLDGVPRPIPGVVVEATLRASDPISVDDTAYDSGPVVAKGRSPPAILAGEATQGAEYSDVGGRPVYGITVPLVVEGTVPRTTGYSLRIDVFIDNPACNPDSGTVMTGNVRPHSDPLHRPRLQASAFRQMAIDSLVPRFVDNGTSVQVDAGIRSLWGGYDVDEGNLTLEVQGPTGTMRLRPVAVRQHIAEAYHHSDPANVTWALDAKDLPSGLYWVSLNATNDQHTATAQATAAFRLGPDVAYPVLRGEPIPDLGSGVQAMPAIGILPLVLVLLVIGVRLAIRR